MKLESNNCHSDVSVIGLSALLITFNEENNIKSVIDNLSFANEIIIVDSFSTDNTVKIASTFENVKIIQNDFINFADQRNFAIQQASNPWVLFIDADERISSELKKEIQSVLSRNGATKAYEMYRTFLFKNQPLRFSGWQTDKIYRLFKKADCYYDPTKIVHEKLIVNGVSEVLNNQLLHYSYSDYKSYKNKMEHYGKMKSFEAFQKGTKPNFFHFYIRPAYQFLYQYIIRLGILDGTPGIIICFLNAFSVYVRFQELKKMKAQIN